MSATIALVREFFYAVTDVPAGDRRRERAGDRRAASC